MESLDHSGNHEHSFMRALLGHEWPGNVRELENVIERSLVLCSGTKLEAADIKLDNELKSYSDILVAYR